jgi:hypothetical protein
MLLTSNRSAGSLISKLANRMLDYEMVEGNNAGVSRATYITMLFFVT